jgi:flagellar hook assembly protein FlgD
MKIFSREGKLVKTILENNLSSGSYVFEWNGTSKSGNKVASGIYLLVIRGALGEQRFKLVVIK